MGLWSLNMCKPGLERYLMEHRQTEGMFIKTSLKSSALSVVKSRLDELRIPVHQYCADDYEDIATEITSREILNVHLRPDILKAMDAIDNPDSRHIIVTDVEQLTISKFERLFYILHMTKANYTIISQRSFKFLIGLKSHSGTLNFRRYLRFVALKTVNECMAYLPSFCARLENQATSNLTKFAAFFYRNFGTRYFSFYELESYYLRSINSTSSDSTGSEAESSQIPTEVTANETTAIESDVDEHDNSDSVSMGEAPEERQTARRPRSSVCRDFSHDRSLSSEREPAGA